MRITRLALRGIGPFRDDVEVRLADVTGRLIALVGDNGAGKSTLAECILGAIDRTTPTRGSLTDLATGRDSFVELELEADRDYRIRQLADGVARKGETVLTGTRTRHITLLADAKVSTFDEWRKANLPPTAVLLSTVFAAQGSGGFLDLSTAERKAVMNRTLGIEGFEQLAERARERARDAKARLDAKSEAVRTERARLGSVEKYELALQEARGLTNAHEEDLRIAREALAAAKARHVDLVAAWENAEAARAKREEALRRVSEAEAEVSRVSARLQSAEQTLSDADRVRAAAARLEELRPELERLREDRLERRTRHADTVRALQEIDREAESALQAYNAAKARMDAGEDARRDLKDARYVAAGVEEKRVEARRLDEAVTRLREETLSHKDGRIGSLRHAHEQIRDGEIALDTVRTYSDEVLDEDDHEAKRDIAAEVRQQERDAAEASRELRMMETAAARIPDLEKAVAAATEAEQEMNTARARQEHASNGRREVVLREQVQKAKVEEISQQIDELDREILDLQSVAARLQDVTAAEARLEEIRRAEETAEAALADAQRALDACPEPPDAEPVPDVSAQERAVESAEEALRAALSGRALAEKSLEDAHAAAERIGNLEADVFELEEELADWTRLGQDLGAKGVPAYLIDAAGPEISEIATSLLHECFGPRWTVSLTTTRLSADGKRDLETFEVRVLDTESGRDGEALRLSGGERVIVGEALSLALTTIACRRAGFSRPTLVRDESGAALDPERARAYVAMLRRAADLIGADKVLIVSHSQEVVALCDARIEIEDGRVSVAG